MTLCLILAANEEAAVTYCGRRWSCLYMNRSELIHMQSVSQTSYRYQIIVVKHFDTSHNIVQAEENPTQILLCKTLCGNRWLTYMWTGINVLVNSSIPALKNGLPVSNFYSNPLFDPWSVSRPVKILCKSKYKKIHCSPLNHTLASPTNVNVLKGIRVVHLKLYF